MAGTILTFADLQTRCLRWLDESEQTTPGAANTNTLQLVKDAVNASHRRMLSRRVWGFMKWPNYQTFQTVQGQQVYALHSQCSRLLLVYDKDRQIFLPALPRREWPSVGVQVAGQPMGTATYGFIFGTNWPVQVQPLVSQTISVVSSNSGDNVSGQGIYIEGEDSSGNFYQETIQLSGTTPVSSVNPYLFLTQVSKVTDTWNGTVTLKSGSTTLTTISPTTPGQWFQTIEFVEPTQGGRNLIYSFQRPPKTLVNDFDIPDTPYPWSEIHVYDALLDMTSYNTELGAKEQTLWKARYDELMNGLLAATEEEIAGAYPRFVRDLDASGPSNRVWNYAP
jgi:hypothetical protein